MRPLPATIALLFVAGLLVLGAPNLRIYHFDVDQADCTLMIGPSGQSILFDFGDAGWNSSRELRKVAPEIRRLLDDRQLSYVVISHLHVDHAGYVGYGGLWGLMEVYGMRPLQILVRNFIAFPGDTSAKGFGLWSDYLRAEPISCSVLFPTLGGIYDLGDGLTMTVCSVNGNGLFPPNAPDTSCPISPNDLSLGFLISYGDFQEWIGGDLGGTCVERHFGPTCTSYYDVETDAAARIGDIEVLRVNHHGSEYSSNAVFVGNLEPEVSIISVGETKSYGHPSMEVLMRLAAISDVYLTTLGNKNGAIREARLSTSMYSSIRPDVGTILVETDGLTFSVIQAETGQILKTYMASPVHRVDADGDGYYEEVDPDDTDSSIVPGRHSGGSD